MSNIRSRNAAARLGQIYYCDASILPVFRLSLESDQGGVTKFVAALSCKFSVGSSNLFCYLALDL
jgi:hypothetical protein